MLHKQIFLKGMRTNNKDNIKGDVCSAKDTCTNELSKDSQVFGLKKVIWSCVDMRRCEEQSALTRFHIATVALFLYALDASSGAYPLILGHGLWPGAGRGVNGRKFNQNTLGSSIQCTSGQVSAYRSISQQKMTKMQVARKRDNQVMSVNWIHLLFDVFCIIKLLRILSWSAEA